MATRRGHGGAPSDAYDRLLVSARRSVEVFHGPRHLLDQLLAGEPVVVQGWRIHQLPANGWFEVHPDGRFLPTNSPMHGTLLGKGPRLADRQAGA